MNGLYPGDQGQMLFALSFPLLARFQVDRMIFK